MTKSDESQTRSPEGYGKPVVCNPQMPSTFRSMCFYLVDRGSMLFGSMFAKERGEI